MRGEEGGVRRVRRKTVAGTEIEVGGDEQVSATYLEYKQEQEQYKGQEEQQKENPHDSSFLGDSELCACGGLHALL